MCISKTSRPFMKYILHPGFHKREQLKTTCSNFLQFGDGSISIQDCKIQSVFAAYAGSIFRIP